MRVWEAGLPSREQRLSALNEGLIRSVNEYLGIRTPILQSRPLAAIGAKTHRLLDLLRKVGADTYVSGPSAKGYLDQQRFEIAGMRLEYKSYVYPSYPQLWGPFEGSVTILDVIANCGPRARELITSLVPNEVAVP
jgi:hypothetical protein